MEPKDPITQAWDGNVKAAFDFMLNQWDRRNTREQELYNQYAQFGLERAKTLAAHFDRQVADAQTVGQRSASNAATVDHLANVAALAQLTEYRAIGADMAELKTALNKALSQEAFTSSVAQGAMQTGAAVNVSDVAMALAILLAKILGEEATHEEPAAE